MFVKKLFIQAKIACVEHGSDIKSKRRRRHGSLIVKTFLLAVK